MRYSPSRLANEVRRERSSLPQYGHVSASNGHRVVQRPQTSRCSAAGVITANSGSPPQSGQYPRVQGAKSVREHTSAQRMRNGRMASWTTGSSPAASGSGVAEAGSTAVMNHCTTTGSS